VDALGIGFDIVCDTRQQLAQRPIAVTGTADGSR
jgi:hypothetical protein